MSSYNNDPKEFLVSPTIRYPPELFLCNILHNYSKVSVITALTSLGVGNGLISIYIHQDYKLFILSLLDMGQSIPPRSNQWLLITWAKFQYQDHLSKFRDSHYFDKIDMNPLTVKMAFS